MPFYYAMGKIPHKRHTQFRKPDGTLYAEELFGEEGFSGVESLLYHQHPPTRVSKIARHGSVCLDEWQQDEHRHHHLKTADAAAGGDPVEGRHLLMYNSDCAIFPSPSAPPIPIAPPIRVIIPTCHSTIRRTRPPSAPSAIRTPISRVRCATE